MDDHSYKDLTNKYQQNIEILRKLDLMPETWTASKKKELDECAHLLKNWRSASATFATEACVRIFMESIENVERKALLVSEIEKSKEITAACTSLSEEMERATKHNKKIIQDLRDNLSVSLVGKKEQNPNETYLSEGRSLAYERINDLIKKSIEQDKEIMRLSLLKKSAHST